MYFNAHDGDRGEVTLNGTSVEAIRGEDGPFGWVEIHVQPYEIVNGESLRRETIQGNVVVNLKCNRRHDAATGQKRAWYLSQHRARRINGNR